MLIFVGVVFNIYSYDKDNKYFYLFNNSNRALSPVRVII